MRLSGPHKLDTHLIKSRKIWEKHQCWLAHTIIRKFRYFPLHSITLILFFSYEGMEKKKNNQLNFLEKV